MRIIDPDKRTGFLLVTVELHVAFFL